MTEKEDKRCICMSIIGIIWNKRVNCSIIKQLVCVGREVSDETSGVF